MVVGLGNPGDRYVDTRHNAGFLFADYFLQNIFPGASFDKSEKFNTELYKKGELLVVKPLSFMNRSGRVIARLSRHFKVTPEQIFVAHDDLDINLGEYKIQKTIGPKDHNGLNSIVENLGNAGFWRIRLGIDNRKGARDIPGEAYVLGLLPAEELDMLRQTIRKATLELLGNYIINLNEQ